jgi:hypothetical protein
MLFCFNPGGKIALGNAVVPATVFLDKNLSINLVPGTFREGIFGFERKPGSDPSPSFKTYSTYSTSW